MSAPAQPLDRFDRVLVPALTYPAAAVLFFMMALTCVDVVGRYLFNTPVTGGFELTEVSLAALIFLGLPLVTLRNDHVVVDLFDRVTPDWLLRIQHVVASLVGAACAGYLAYRLWLRALTMSAAGETTAVLKIKLAWLVYGMSLLMALTAVAMLVLALRKPARHQAGGDV
jgi:TRAP-type C4-dicarboxylate transport system permease small subunit